MKKSSSIFKALALLICLSGCDGSGDGTNTAETPATTKPKTMVDPKLTARTAPLLGLDYDKRDAVEDLDTAGMAAPSESDRDAEKYDYDIDMPAPESGEPVTDEELPKE
ncbi:MAG: hypothetical protein PHH59_08775 [Methylovulum sp.]|uniref:hypothetical protein n=1 Tax=Methylovulum sp. TaxID=1916980 RepID=UPI00261EF457|nr:hypothetical protein [Methylovulum sp.]MDD2724096.1 hypothetical protein [Methylovulum sp.]MDD5124722.1 hypothetical protein [Methylovulum sp.]